MNYTVHGILQVRILEWVAFPFSRGSSQTRDEPRSPTLPAEPPGKPKNTRVGSLSLLLWIFPTQESNWAHLHCRRVLYQLSYQGSLDICVYTADSLHCSAEANNTINQLFSKKKKSKKGTGLSFHPTSALCADIQHRQGVRQPGPVWVGATKGPDALQN